MKDEPIPCETCLVLARCKNLVCPDPPRFIPSTKIVRLLLTSKLDSSLKCPELRKYCNVENGDENAFRNIYKVTNFFSTPYGEFWHDIS